MKNKIAFALLGIVSVVALFVLFITGFSVNSYVVFPYVEIPSRALAQKTPYPEPMVDIPDSLKKTSEEIKSETSEQRDARERDLREVYKKAMFRSYKNL